MRLRQALGVIAVGAWGVSAPLAAQEVRGRVVDEDSDEPVVGAMVNALGGGGEIWARTLTDERGDFVLSLPPSASAAFFQVVRIGYASQDFPADVPSRSDPRMLRLSSSPIELEGIGVVAENLCGNDLLGSGRVYDIWLEARKALEMTRLTETQRSLGFDAEIVARVLDPDDLSERERRVEPRRLTGRTPYYSLSGEQMTRGWIATEADGTLRYWAPDASALLSREFEEQHCFGAELGESEIVLSFAPNRAREDIPDIRGEVFLDRATNRLERMSFEYSSLPLPREAAGMAGGEVHFAPAPNGSWIVTEWWIRMPVVTVRWEQDHVRSIQRTEVVELREQGGRIVRIRAGTEVVPVERRPPA